MSHIALTTAEDMTALYRQEKENILDSNYRDKATLAICETFDIAEVQSVVNQTGCEKLRIYYGMDTNYKVHAILIGVDENDDDIMPGNTLPLGITNILEEAVRCPSQCPPTSSLNS